MSKKPLSLTMAVSLAETIDRGGKLVRHQGGYWTVPGAVRSGTQGHPFEFWVNASTIDALVDRGELRFTEWKVGRGTRFPVAAEVVPQ